MLQSYFHPSALEASKEIEGKNYWEPWKNKGIAKILLVAKT